jgi:hypothetical protein
VKNSLFNTQHFGGGGFNGGNGSHLGNAMAANHQTVNYS